MMNRISANSVSLNSKPSDGASGPQRQSQSISRSSNHSNSTTFSAGSAMKLPTRKPSVEDLTSLTGTSINISAQEPQEIYQSFRSNTSSTIGTSTASNSSNNNHKGCCGSCSDNDTEFDPIKHSIPIANTYEEAGSRELVKPERKRQQSTAAASTATCTTVSITTSTGTGTGNTDKESVAPSLEPCPTDTEDHGGWGQSRSNHSSSAQRSRELGPKQPSRHTSSSRDNVRASSKKKKVKKPGEIAIRQPRQHAPSSNPRAKRGDSNRSTGIAEATGKSNKTTLLTKQRIRSFMTDYYADFDSIFQNGSSKQVKKTCFEAFFDQYYTKDILWIRSSGNPIGRKDLAGMLCDDIDIDHAILVSIDNITLMAGGMVASVTYTADLKFSFKGQPQSDRTVLSSVLQVTNDIEIRIAHVHWSVGGPIPKESRWETEK
ncbi:expressed unknown protein [Seminavis robusta]|uniref:NTF2 domain-containing protein n=1 Tax=Seminavis robusta TaxID=568900 RepID=A0A9N8GZX3_9STRA|nr:expressed unknown protein [Seminavis robusta]|eukprot:Sro10_g008140.1 n/a (432) ;mRNA; r:133565-134860